MDRTLMVWLVLLGCSSTYSVARAEHAPSTNERSIKVEQTDNLRRARELFQEAVQLQSSGRWAAAATKYREAATIKETPGLRFRAGYCESRRERLLEAKQEYLRAQALLDEHPGAEDVRRLLPEAMANVDARIPTLLVQLPKTVENVELRVDSKQIPEPSLSTRLSLNPGVHAVLLRTLKGQEFRRTVRLVAGAHMTLTASFPKAGRSEPEQAGPMQPAPQVDRPSVDWPLLTLMSGVSLTAVGLGAGLSYVWVERQAARRHQRQAGGLEAGACRDPGIDFGRRCGALKGALRDQRNARQRAGWAFAASGVGAAITFTGAWLGAGTNVTTSAMFTPTGGTVSLNGSL